MTFKQFLGFCLTVTFALASCKKSDSNSTHTNSSPKADTDVYVTGYISNPGDTSSVATYWKNGVATQLTSSNYSNTSAITTNGNDVYIAGTTAAYGSAAKSKAVYWKNGVITNLTDGTTAAATTDIVISGSDVYVTGVVDLTSVYWKNGVMTKLTDNTIEGKANGIFISGNDVYICGEAYYKQTQTLAPVFWKNGAMTQISTGSLLASASSIAVQNDQVYVAYYNFLGPGVAYYWQNGVSTRLSGNLYSSSTNKILLNGNDIYITGNTSPANGQNSLSYWKNNVIQTLSGPAASTFANINGITVLGNNVYIAGQYANGEAVYWKNGTAVKLGDVYSGAVGIAVIPH